MSVIARDPDNLINFCRRVLSEVGVRGWETSLDCEMYDIAFKVFKSTDRTGNTYITVGLHCVIIHDYTVYVIIILYV